jgi:nucleoid-associated protein YgaU
MRSDAKVALGVSAVCLAGIIGYALFVPAEKPAGTSMSVRPTPAPVTPPVLPATPLDNDPATQPTTLPTTLPSTGLTVSAPTPGSSSSTGTEMGGLNSPTATPSGAVNGDWNAILAGKAAVGAAGTTLMTPTGGRTATGNTPTFGTVSTPSSIFPSPYSSTRPSYLGGPLSGSSGLTGGGDTYAIKRGDSFATIAAAKYGNSKYWKVIAEANPGVDSRRLKVGQTIKVPELPAKYSGGTSTGTVSSGSTGSTGTSGSTVATLKTGGSSTTVVGGTVDPQTQYTVVSGDSLYRISTKLYGNTAQADAIYELNKDLIGTNKANLKIGQLLKLPAPPTKK